MGSKVPHERQETKARIIAKQPRFKHWAIRWLLSSPGYQVGLLPPTRVGGFLEPEVQVTVLAYFFIQNVFTGMICYSPGFRVLVVLLPKEGASFCKPCFASCRLAKEVEQPTHETSVCAWLVMVMTLSILGTPHPWGGDWGFAPGAASSATSSLSAMGGGGPSQGHVLMGRSLPPERPYFFSGFLNGSGSPTSVSVVYSDPRSDYNSYIVLNRQWVGEFIPTDMIRIELPENDYKMTILGSSKG